MKKTFLTLAVLIASQTALQAQAYERGWGHSYFSSTHRGWGGSEVAPEISSRFSDNNKVIGIIQDAHDDVQYFYATNGEVIGARMMHALKVIKEIAPELSEAEQLALLSL